MPATYLGLPLFGGRARKELWNLVVNKIQSRRPTWKGRWLSLVGRAQLIKPVPHAIPIVFLSLFVMPKLVEKCIFRLTRTFLWSGTTEHEMFPLVK